MVKRNPAHGIREILRSLDSTSLAAAIEAEEEIARAPVKRPRSSTERIRKAAVKLRRLHAGHTRQSQLDAALDAYLAAIRA